MVNKVNELLNEHEKIQLELKFYFDDVNFSNIFLDEFISEVLEKEFYFWSTEVEGDKYAEFWSYFSGDKIDNEDYKIIRKFFLNKELKIKTADLNKDEIIESIKKNLLHNMLFFKDGFEYDESYFINRVIERMLNLTKIPMYYHGLVENEYEGNTRDKLLFTGIITLSKRDELIEGYVYGDGFDEEIQGKLVKNPIIDYNKVTDSNFDSLIFINNGELTDNGDINTIIDNLNVFPSPNNLSYGISYRYDNYEASWGEAGDVCIAIDVEMFENDKIWAVHLANGYKDYNEKKFKNAFLMSFISFEALVESFIYKIKEAMSKLIENILIISGVNIDVNIPDMILKEEYSKEMNIKITKQIQEETSIDLSWYRNIYWRFCNDQRSLVDDKFKDILKLHLQIEHVIDSATLTIFDFSKVFGDSESLESYLLKELNTLADVRNGIAHGVDNGYAESDYKQLFEKMIVIQAQVISTLKNSEFFIS